MNEIQMEMLRKSELLCAIAIYRYGRVPEGGPFVLVPQAFIRLFTAHYKAQKRIKNHQYNCYFPI